MKKRELNFVTWLFVTLLVLKLIGINNWSWWWITSPLWGCVALAIFFIIAECLVDCVVCCVYPLKKVEPRIHYLKRLNAEKEGLRNIPSNLPVVYCDVKKCVYHNQNDYKTCIRQQINIFDGHCGHLKIKVDGNTYKFDEIDKVPGGLQ